MTIDIRTNHFTKRTCCSCSVEALGVLKVLSVITGYEVDKFERKVLADDGLVEMTVVSRSPFLSSSSPYAVVVYEGLFHCLQKMCVACPELDLFKLEEEELIRHWVQRCWNSNSPASMKDFANNVETHLEQKHRPFLLGDHVTVADICVAIFLYCFNEQNQTSPFLTSVSHPKAHKFIYEILLKNQGLLDVLLQLLHEHANMEQLPPAATAQVTSAMQSLQLLVKDDESPLGTPLVEYPPLSTEESSTNTILLALTKASIPHYAYVHTKSNTAEELVANVPLPSIDHVHTKNLLFKDKKHGLFLVTTTASASGADVSKALSKIVEGKANFRLASSDVLKETLGVEPGCVGPLCIINDTSSMVTLVLDESLMQNYSYIHSHPLDNVVSCILRPQDLLRYVKEVANHEPILLSFAPTTTATEDPKPKGNKSEQPPKSQQQQQQTNNNKASTKKGETLLALQWKKSENFPNWYSDVITLSEMISYYNVSGCYILRPWSYKIWEIIQNWFNEQIQEYGVENAYFPMFVSKDRLEREKDHVEGFAPEVAWVTKSGDTDLAVPIAIRPTSETIMYPAFSDWIKSHRDLPLKLNQWSNVVRWEFKWPTPFLRTREFLWQEGHTAHSTHGEAEEMVLKALEWYRGVYEELLAIPVIKGYKTEKEKFAGGHRTTTVEAYVPGSGRSIQGATSHDLGQNFGKMFDISFQNASGTSEVAWQTSWGLTTRTIGVMVMLHGDDQGLVLPPRVAPLQCVIVPIVSKSCPLETISLYCQDVLTTLKAAGVRIKYDDRTIYNPGWKYNHWEQKGVPIRIEIGPRDMENRQVRIVVRRNGEKLDVKMDESFAPFIVEKLEVIQKQMFETAKEIRDMHLVQVTEWKDFVPNLEKNNMVLTPWIGGEHQDWEDWVKEKSREESLAARGEAAEDDRTATSVAAKTLCIPFEQPMLPPGTKCIASDQEATCWILWGALTDL